MRGFQQSRPHARLFSRLYGILGLAVGIGILFPATATLAAERVVIKYGPFAESVSVAELTTLAEHGETSPGLASLLRLAKQEPQGLQKLLNQQVKVNAVTLDRLLNSPIGNVALERLGQTIHTPAKEADVQALRAALVLSASKDGNITLLEALQNYPTEEVQLEGKQLAAAARQIDRIGRQVEQLRGLIGLFQ